MSAADDRVKREKGAGAGAEESPATGTEAAPGAGADPRPDKRLSRRVLVMVLDGLGIGAMEDVTLKRPQDRGANTLGHVIEATGVRLPTLERMGLGNALALSGWYGEGDTASAGRRSEPDRDPGVDRGGTGGADRLPVRGSFSLVPVERPIAAWGRSALAYEGADSFAGHQEIMGTVLRAGRPRLFEEVSAGVEAALRRAGYRVEVLGQFPGRLLLVEGRVVVADNLEADPGLIYNLTVPFDEIPFEAAVRMAEVVRQVVTTTRVIVFGSTGYGVEKILRHVEHRPTGQTGVNSPALGAYDENFQVRHLGYGVDPSRQLPAKVYKAGGYVALIGKMADVISTPAHFRNTTPDTGEVLRLIREQWERGGEAREAARVSGEAWSSGEAGQRGVVVTHSEAGARSNAGTRSHAGIPSHAGTRHEAGLPLLVAATVQETDLSGHEADADRFAAILKQVDDWLAEFLPGLHEGDLVIITADHGNDPLNGTGDHTREYVPVLVWPASAAGGLRGNGTPPGGQSHSGDTHGAGTPESGDKYSLGARHHPGGDYLGTRYRSGDHYSFGTRRCLGDVAATAARFLGVEPVQDGTPIG